MNRINNILIIFVVFLGIVVFGFWQFIQTETFAGFISEKITKEIESRLSMKLTFSRLKVELFPPATIFKEATIVNKNQNKEKGYNIKTNEIGFYFGFFSFFSNKISIEKIKFSDGYINVRNKSKALVRSGQLLSLDKKQVLSIFNSYQKNIFERMPVRIKGLEFDQLLVRVNDKSAHVKNLFVGLYREAISLIGNVEQIVTKITDKNLKHIDSIIINGQFQKEKIRFVNFEFKEKFTTFSYAGDYEFGEKPKIKGKIRAKGLASNLVEKYIKNDKFLFDGFFDIETKIEGVPPNFDLDFKVSMSDIESRYARIRNLHFSGRKVKSKLFLDQLRVNHNGGSAEINKTHEIFDFKSKIAMKEKIEVKIDKIHTNDALYLLKRLSGLKARMSGKLFIYRDQGELIFESNEKVKITDFSFYGKNNLDRPILKNDGFTLNSSFIRVQKNKTTLMDFDLSIDYTKIKLSGFANKQQMNFKSNNADIDLLEIGPISKVQMEGRGKTSFEITGPIDDVQFYFLPELDDFKLIGLNFGSVKTDLAFRVDGKKLTINRFIGRSGETNYIGKGSIVFGKDSNMDIKLNFPKATYADSSYMYERFVKFMPIDIKTLGQYYSASYKITGPIQLDKMRISGEFRADNVNIFTEEIDNVSGKFKFINRNLIFEDVFCKKGLAQLMANYQYNLKNKYFEYDATIKKLELDSIKFYKNYGSTYNGEVSASFFGSGTKDDYSVKTQIETVNSNIRNIPVKNANLTIFNTKEELFLTGQFLGEEFFIDLYINLNEKKSSKRSYVNGWVNSNSGRVLTALFSDHNIDDGSIEGNFTGTIKSDFSISKFDYANVNVDISRFKMKKGEFELFVEDKFSKIKIQKGNIKTWDVRMSGEENSFASKASGSLYKNFKLENSFNIKSDILETISNKIRNAHGVLRGNFDIAKSNKNIKFSGRGFSEDVSFFVPGFKKNVEELNVEVLLDDQDIFIENFEGKFGNGKFKVTGDSKILVPFPKPNITISLENSEIPILKNSSVVVSGTGTLTGRRIPYLFKGNFSILHGEIRDEIRDIVKGNKNNTTQSRFIPESKINDKFNLLNYEVGISIFRPILAKNSLLDMRVDGNLTVKGNLVTPLITGNLTTIPGNSKFVFKGHEFSILEGLIGFNDEKSKKPPTVGFIGVSKVNDYDVKFAISGEASKLDIELTSEPPLAHEDILSLLTLGVTSEISKNLEDSDLQSVTSIGIGTLLLDQFKVNQGLNQSLGLRLSVSPEFESDDSSLISGREGVAGATSTKLKSATKIKLQKKLSKKIDMSVSSTVGGDIAQKQEMNINYNVNKNISIQGVYEVKSTEENDVNENPDSVGADIKFRWSFK